MDEQSTARSITLAEIVARLGGEVLGDAHTRVFRLAPLESAASGDIAFTVGGKYSTQLADSGASAVILSPADRDLTSLPRIVTDNPYLYYARLAQLMHPPLRPAPGIHARAVVEETAQVDVSASVGACAYVGARARLGPRVVVEAGCHVGADTVIGADSWLHPNVSIYPDCRIGERTLIHSGAVVGADGFGIAHDGERWVKIPQTGRAVVGSDVEIGANTTIDRGALEDTVIEDGVKLDNQIQVGHNVRIGAHTAIAGCVGIAGSTKIGRGCRIGGGVGIVGHIEICDGVTVSGFTLITKSIKRPGTYTSGLPQMPHAQWLKSVAQLRRLEELAERVQALEKKLRESEARHK